MGTPRPHEIEVHTTAIARLSAAEMRANRIAADAPQADGVYTWSVNMPHYRRLQRLRELGERTDDLWLLSEMSRRRQVAW